jgi:hypothetical protein
MSLTCWLGVRFPYWFEVELVEEEDGTVALKDVADTGIVEMMGKPVCTLYGTVMTELFILRMPMSHQDVKPSVWIPVFSARCLRHRNLTGHSRTLLYIVHR